MSRDHDANSVFVYGTLKRGEVRVQSWPHAPVQVVVARVRGALFDVGPYPAMIDGTDWVGGERWVFEARHMSATLRQLDAIEGYRQPSQQDLYRRQLIECRDDDGETTVTFTYVFADPQRIAAAYRVPPNLRGICVWTPRPGQRIMDDDVRSSKWMT